MAKIEKADMKNSDHAIDRYIDELILKNESSPESNKKNKFEQWYFEIESPETKEYLEDQKTLLKNVKFE